MAGVVEWSLWEVTGVIELTRVETYQRNLEYADVQAMASLYVERQPKSKTFYIMLWDGEKHHKHIMLEGSL